MVYEKSPRQRLTTSLITVYPTQEKRSLDACSTCPRGKIGDLMFGRHTSDKSGKEVTSPTKRCPALDPAPACGLQVDAILDRDHYTLEELLDEDDLIQECKSLNNRLITL